MNDKKIQFIYDFIDTVLSVFRILLLSRFKTTLKIQRKHDQCIILGNGPSLIPAMEACQEKWDQYDLIAVNHMAQSEQYLEYKPMVYVLCDPAFWFAPGYEEHRDKVEHTYREMLQNTDWKLQLYVPYQAGQVVKEKLASNRDISVHFFNKTKFDGYKWLKYTIFNKQWGMVRPQNILNAVLMLSIYSEYKIIFLAGADSDWLRRLWVDEQNNLRLTDLHFYSKDGKGVAACGTSIKLHDMILTQYYCFKSYTEIGQYATYRNVRIYNSCLHSFIDAYEKKLID